MRLLACAILLALCASVVSQPEKSSDTEAGPIQKVMDKLKGIKQQFSEVVRSENSQNKQLRQELEEKLKQEAASEAEKLQQQVTEMVKDEAESKERRDQFIQREVRNTDTEEEEEEHDHEQAHQAHIAMEGRPDSDLRKEEKDRLRALRKAEFEANLQKAREEKQKKKDKERKDLARKKIQDEMEGVQKPTPILLTQDDEERRREDVEERWFADAASAKKKKDKKKKKGEFLVKPKKQEEEQEDDEDTEP